MGVGALLLVFLILFFISPAETGGKLAALREANNISDNLMKGISSGIYTTAVLFVAGLCVFLYSEVRNLFK